MNTCKTCKYWGYNQPSENAPNECGLILLDHESSKDPAFIDADASDDSGLYAKLMTTADFGCVLYSHWDK